MLVFQKKQNVAKKVAIGGAIAATVGYLAGVLTAPKSGKETRKDIKDAANNSLAQAEKELKKLHTDLDKLIKQAKTNGKQLNAKARKELDELIVKAKDAKEKTREVLSAIHEGSADDKELNKAINQANQSLNNLKKYLKK